MNELMKNKFNNFFTIFLFFFTVMDFFQRSSEFLATEQAILENRFLEYSRRYQMHLDAIQGNVNINLWNQHQQAASVDPQPSTSSGHQRAVSPSVFRAVSPSVFLDIDLADEETDYSSESDDYDNDNIINQYIRDQHIRREVLVVVHTVPSSSSSNSSHQEEPQHAQPEPQQPEPQPQWHLPQPQVPQAQPQSEAQQPEPQLHQLQPPPHLRFRCSICLESALDEEPTAIRCGHVFHYGCLQTWLRTQNTCPNCRYETNISRVAKLVH